MREIFRESMYCHISSHICQQRNNQCCAYCNKGQQEQKRRGNAISTAKPQIHSGISRRERGRQENWDKEPQHKEQRRPAVQSWGENLEGTAQIRTFGGIYFGEPCAVFVRRKGHRGRCCSWAAKGARAGTELPELSLSPFAHNLYLEWALPTNTETSA